MLIGGYKFFRYLARGGLFNINLEVTKRCNARCNFCDYWKEKPGPELRDYVPVVEKLKPLSVSLTGGEPLLREDLPDLIASLRRSFGFLNLSLITNGSLLTKEKGLALWRRGSTNCPFLWITLMAGMTKVAGLACLTGHILAVAPELAAVGVKLCFNCVIKKWQLQGSAQDRARVRRDGDQSLGEHLQRLAHQQPQPYDSQKTSFGPWWASLKS